VVKIDVAKNETLAAALRIKGNPTYIIYKNGEMKWRQTGQQDANTLISLVEQYV
jgi:thioredoxin 1